MKKMSTNAHRITLKEHRNKIIVLSVILLILLVGTKGWTQQVPDKVMIQTEPSEQSFINEKYKEAKEQNNDVYAWLKIDDTTIDFPVMYKDNTYYLTRDLDLQEDRYGLPFVDERCNIEKRSTNLLIHGHSTLSGPSGRMFDDLANYLDPSFYETHQTIHFDTMEATHEYQVLMVIRSKIFYTDEVGYRYYNFIDVDNEEEYNENIANLKQLTIYDTHVPTQYGDRLLTLSTCYGAQENGRIAIIAKEIKSED